MPSELATGVRVASGSRNVDLFAKKIVSDAGVINTFKKLLPTDVAKKSCECTGFIATVCGPDNCGISLEFWAHVHHTETEFSK